MKRNTGRPRRAHGKKKEWGGRKDQLPNRLRGMPGPSVEERILPDEHVSFDTRMAHARPIESFCPRCATLGQRVLLSGTHFKQPDGMATSEFGCACGWVKTVTYRPR